MESSTVISTGKATVVIKVNPQVTQDTVVFVDGHEAGGKNHNMGTFQGFFKAQPKTLGTVQIIIGVMVFLLGILLTADLYITYWGSFIYITAGSLSVAAEKKLENQNSVRTKTLCMVKASLGMNVVSAVTAGLAILLMSIRLAVSIYYPGLNAEILRFTGILLVFTIPQFILSICISAFACKAACKAACNKKSTVVNVALNQRMKRFHYTSHYHI